MTIQPHVLNHIVNFLESLQVPAERIHRIKQADENYPKDDEKVWSAIFAAVYNSIRTGNYEKTEKDHTDLYSVPFTDGIRESYPGNGFMVRYPEGADQSSAKVMFRLVLNVHCNPESLSVIDRFVLDSNAHHYKIPVDFEERVFHHDPVIIYFLSSPDLAKVAELQKNLASHLRETPEDAVLGQKLYKGIELIDQKRQQSVQEAIDYTKHQDPALSEFLSRFFDDQRLERNQKVSPGQNYTINLLIRLIAEAKQQYLEDSKKPGFIARARRLLFGKKR